MKKIIEGREYNTETAQQLATYTHEQGTICEHTTSLYRKRNGEYFIHVHYANEIAGNDSDGIGPIKTEYARSWAKSYLSNDLYKKLFESHTWTDKVKLTLNVTAETRERLKVMAASRKCSLSDVVDSLVESAPLNIE